MILGFLMSTDATDLIIVVAIFFIPFFFLFRRFYRKRFEGNDGKVLRWTIVSSLLLAPAVAMLLIVMLVMWAVFNESR